VRRLGYFSDDAQADTCCPDWRRQAGVTHGLGSKLSFRALDTGIAEQQFPFPRQSLFVRWQPCQVLRSFDTLSHIELLPSKALCFQCGDMLRAYMGVYRNPALKSTLLSS